ncbi:MAG TPA: uroporphyrinogen-III synthase [Rhodanobacteraceae bacterium]|nr:uroporphyrinogen-III synthase [Rhodanobacteraceae bacterium]
MARARPFAGIRVAITRPAGTGTAWARRIRELGGTPLLLPGASLRPASDAVAARKALRSALRCDVAIFTSPAAVRFARALGLPRTRTQVLAPGAGTLRALRHAGLAHAEAPAREDSEGILALPLLRQVRGLRVGLIGAAGGRGLLDRELAARGATVVRAHVYQRRPARLDRRHAEALQRNSRKPLYVLLSSAEALANILAALPEDARRALCAGSAVVSSARLATAARKAGFARVSRAASAHADAMLAAVNDDAASGAASMHP